MRQRKSLLKTKPRRSVKRTLAQSPRTSDGMPTGITGFDEITGIGLPRRRLTAILGEAGSGKTIFALQMLVKGASEYDEPGIFVAFEESPQQIMAYGSHFGWGVEPEKKLAFIDAQLPRSILNGGDFDLVGLLAGIQAKATAMKAQRVVFDGIDVLLDNLGNPLLARREVFRIREWVLASGLTAIVTAKAGGTEGQVSSDYDFLQFMADCVVVLRHRLTGPIAVRGVRVSKLRGSAHSANELPFAFTPTGFEVAPGANVTLEHPVSAERVSSGIERLDTMMGGGYFRGTSVLVSGSPGTAKTTLAGAFVLSACRRHEPTLSISFDEAPNQIVRNLSSVGIHLAPYVKKGVLWLCSLRARAADSESQLAYIRSLIREHKIRNLVVDPISALAYAGGPTVVEAAAIQLVDFAKSLGVTILLTKLLSSSASLLEDALAGVSTIVDTWMHVSYVSQGGERNRALTIIKARGMAHSNQVRELVLSSKGITLADVYSAAGEVLMGTLRWEKETQDLAAREVSRREAERRLRELALALTESDARAETLAHARGSQQVEFDRIDGEQRKTAELFATGQHEMQYRRGADLHTNGAPGMKRSRHGN